VSAYALSMGRTVLMTLVVTFIRKHRLSLSGCCWVIE